MEANILKVCGGEFYQKAIDLNMEALGAYAQSWYDLEECDDIDNPPNNQRLDLRKKHDLSWWFIRSTRYNYSSSGVGITTQIMK